MAKQSSSRALAPVSLPSAAELFDAYFTMVAADGLDKTTLSRLAEHHAWPLNALRKAWPTPAHILSAFHEHINADMLAHSGYDPAGTPRDIYFDLLMARLDALQPYRAGLERLARDLPSRPDLALVLARHIHALLDTLIDLAGDGGSFWQTPLKRAGLGILYGRLLHVWSRDTSMDMSKSMAFLDKQLEKAEARFK